MQLQTGWAASESEASPKGTRRGPVRPAWYHLAESVTPGSVGVTHVFLSPEHHLSEEGGGHNGSSTPGW